MEKLIPMVVGNWKMNQTRKEIEEFSSTFSSKCSQFKCLFGIAPQAIHLSLLQKNFESCHRELGGCSTPSLFSQNCYFENKGAFTGELSPASLKDLGVDGTIIGHSERRQIFKEDNELLRKKLKNALASGLQVIFCIGETKEEREGGRTFEVLKEQLNMAYTDLTLQNSHQLITAYEPVWAIGTGLAATPEMAEEAHAFIAEHVNSLLKFSSNNSKTHRILYGGSVNPGNIEELLSKSHIHGALVGGASLKADDFIKLCEVANRFS